MTSCVATDSPAMSVPRPSLHTSLVLFLTIYLLFPSEGLDSAATGDNLCAAVSDRDTSSSCNINCFRADPVCGENGVTYWCGCPEAACNGVRVTKRGPCPVGSSGSGLVPGQALLLVHIVWLFVLGLSILFGLM